MVEYAIQTEMKYTEGPIWTQIEMTTYTGDRSTTRNLTNEDIIKAEDIVWGVVEKFRDPKTGPDDRPRFPLNFAGDITERDIFCFLEDERDIVASCFIKHREDFVGIKNLWKFTEELQGEFKNRSRDIKLRNVSVVAESWVEQHHPELVE